MSNIFAIGDSHCIFYHNSSKIKEHWVAFANLPVTWFRLLNEGIDIYNIGNMLKNGHEKYNIKENDKVLFSYGWNDIQKNIYKYHKNNYEKQLKLLITNYINLLKMYEIKYKIIPIVNCIYPNPLKENISINGTFEDRNKYIKYSNTFLQKCCKKNNIKFFNIYDTISDKNGFIKKEYTKDLIHLDYDNIYLRKIIDKKLITLCIK